MSIYITTDCINCGACLPECPNNAIFEGGSGWEFQGKSYAEGEAAPSGAVGFWSSEFYYIVPDLCTECNGFHDTPQCASVCPVDCCLTDPNHEETKEELLKKKDYLDSLGRN
jgi:ferredoxin